MNKNTKVTVSKAGNTVIVAVELPQLDHRKGIVPERYDFTHARAAAIEEYGSEVIGQLASPSIVLENRARTNRLKGRWVFEYTAGRDKAWSKPLPPHRTETQTTPTTIKKSRTRRTRASKTTITTETE